MQHRQCAITFLSQDDQRTDLFNNLSIELMGSNIHRSHLQNFLFSITYLAVQAKNRSLLNTDFIRRIYDINNLHRKATNELETLSISPALKSQITRELEFCKTYLRTYGFDAPSYMHNYSGHAAPAA